MTAAPIFLSIPAFVVGIPVAFVKARLAAVMPTARFKGEAESRNLSICHNHDIFNCSTYLIFL